MAKTTAFKYRALNIHTILGKHSMPDGVYFHFASGETIDLHIVTADNNSYFNPYLIDFLGRDLT